MIPQIVDQLLESIQDTNITEIEYEANGVRIRIARETSHGGSKTAALKTKTPKITPSQTNSVQPEKQEDPIAPSTDDHTKTHLVCASMFGCFYRAPGEDQPPFAKVGSKVVVGQQLGLLEAMKTYIPVEADVAGRIVKIMAENDTAVNVGDPLFEIERDDQNEV
ncbi:MAG: hypothetical protein K9K63_07020 [Desulfotignum sp.]|nr:hypothetical protein [Desulfotignum sp.]